MAVLREVRSNLEEFYTINTIQRNFLILANEHVALSGSDVIRSIAVEAIKTIPDRNWTYLEHEVFGPRLSLNIPQVIFLFVSIFNSIKCIITLYIRSQSYIFSNLCLIDIN